MTRIERILANFVKEAETVLSPVLLPKMQLSPNQQAVLLVGENPES